MQPSPTADDSARTDAAMRFLADRINYERTLSMPNSEEAFKLDRMRDLLHRLGDPHRGLRIIHIAGTKGKGSTASMIAAVLTASGLRTGLFTSPHIERIEERIAIDGRPCSSTELVGLIERIRPIVEEIDKKGTSLISSPTYFEILTAAAFCHFGQLQTEAVVLEVGLGGRLDSTNVCTPCLSIITSISFDHVRQLGETLGAIAAEKAGIIKPGVPVISGVTDDEPREVVRRIASENGSRLLELGVDFDFAYRPPLHLEEKPSWGRLDFGDFKDVAISLPGRHQAANAALALAAVTELRRQGWTISEAAVRRGLAEVDWPARVEVIARHPTVVLDAAHNVASLAALVEVLGESFSAKNRILVFAATRDKDLRGMLEILVRNFDRIVFTRYWNNPRGVPPDELLETAQELSRQSSVVMAVAASPAEAWRLVQGMAKPDDLICIAGSFFFAAEMRPLVRTRWQAASG